MNTINGSTAQTVNVSQYIRSTAVPTIQWSHSIFVIVRIHGGIHWLTYENMMIVNRSCTLSRIDLSRLNLRCHQNSRLPVVRASFAAVTCEDECERCWVLFLMMTRISHMVYNENTTMTKRGKNHVNTFSMAPTYNGWKSVSMEYGCIPKLRTTTVLKKNYLF